MHGPICPNCCYDLLRSEGTLSCYHCGWRYALEGHVIRLVADGFHAAIADGNHDPLTPLFQQALTENRSGFNCPNILLATGDALTPIQIIACCDWHEAMLEREELACEVQHESAVA